MAGIKQLGRQRSELKIVQDRWLVKSFDQIKKTGLSIFFLKSETDLLI